MVPGSRCYRTRRSHACSIAKGQAQISAVNQIESMKPSWQIHKKSLDISFFAVFFSVSALSDSLSDVTSLRSWVDFAGVESSVLYHLFCSLVR